MLEILKTFKNRGVFYERKDLTIKKKKLQHNWKAKMLINVTRHLSILI